MTLHKQIVPPQEEVNSAVAKQDQEGEQWDERRKKMEEITIKNNNKNNIYFSFPAKIQGYNNKKLI